MTENTLSNPYGYSAPLAVHYAGPATPATTSRGPKVWAGAMLLAGGVSLVIVAGCFMIGVLLATNPSAMGSFSTPPPPPRTPDIVLITVLYLLAFLSVAGAATLLFLGAHSLLRLIKA